MAVKIAPTARQQFEDANGNPYVGGKLFTYAAGSSTKQATYTDSTGLTANTNPIILDSAGRTPYGVWLTAGLNYKFVLAPSTDTDPPSSPIFTEDVVSGVNDTTTTTSQWIASAATPTYISGTQFTLVGDKTADFHVGRRLKFTVTAGTVYGLITASAYTTLTTVTVVMDSGALDTGLSAVELSILTATGPSVPKLSSANLTAVGIHPLNTALSGLTAQQSTDIASLSTYVGTLLNDADAATFRDSTGTSSVAFAVNKNGVNQAIPATTYSKVSWGTEEYDTNNNFDNVTNFRFTPTKAGKYLLTASLYMTIVNPNVNAIVALYKNGVSYKEGALYHTISASYGTVSVEAVVTANGSTDYFEIFAYTSDAGGATISGGASASHFSGARLGV